MNIEELLLSDRNRIYITSIINSLQPTEHESATKCLVYMSYPSSQTLNIIMNALTYEISNSEKNTIFRGNSVASKLFKFYSRIVGLPYLFDVLAKYVQQIEEISRRKEQNEGGDMGILDVALEVDDEKGDNLDVESNSMQLQYICTKILNAIFKSIPTIPKEFKIIFADIREKIKITYGRR